VVAVAHARQGIGRRVVGDAERPHALDDAFVPVDRHDGAGKPDLARGAGDGRADEAHADEREPLEDGLCPRGPEAVRHGLSPFMKAASASTTRRLASASPMVRRSASGRP
jgi:hypothetical protein